MERPEIILLRGWFQLIRIRDNYVDFDLAPLPSLFDLEWPEETAKIMTGIFKSLISLLDARDLMFFDELSELIYNGMLPKDYRSSVADVFLNTDPRIGLLLQEEVLAEKEQIYRCLPKRAWKRLR